MHEQNLFAIIPVYNGEQTIKSVIVGVSKYVPLKRIVVVDDGSIDNTPEIVQTSFEKIAYSRHQTNRGKGAALKTGINYALNEAADLIFTLDCDGQHDPEEIPKFLKKIQSCEADIIIGSRVENLKTMPLHRILSNKITSYLVSKKINQTVRDSQSGFRLFKAKIFKDLTLICNYFDFETEVLLKAGRKGYKIAHVDIETIYPQNGVSAIKVKDIFRFIKLYFST